MPRHPDVTVSLPVDADTGILRSRVQKALSQAGFEAAATEYIQETNPLRENPEALMAATRDWVTIEGADAVAAAASTNHPSSGALSDLATPPLGDHPARWQYAVVNVGMFRSPERMGEILATAGAHGWELVTVYDKASNWFSGMEKGFMLMKRPVPVGVTPDHWCLMLNQTGS